MYSMQLLVSPAEALRRCWAAADAFFGGIADWGTHPIAVRHPFCFYYGHVAAFAKLKILPDDPAVRNVLRKILPEDPAMRSAL